MKAPWTITKYVFREKCFFISNGFLSTLAVVVARTDMDKKAAHGTSLFLVDVRDNPGFIKGKVLNKVGQHTYDTAELFFDDVRVPSSSILVNGVTN